MALTGGWFGVCGQVILAAGVASGSASHEAAVGGHGAAPIAPSSAGAALATTAAGLDRAQAAALCTDLPGKADPTKIMRLCGDLPSADEVFSFTASEALLMQVADVSAGYAQAILALRNLSQHGGLEYVLDTTMNVNTNPTRVQTLRMIRGQPISRDEAIALNAGAREGFAVRIARSDAGDALSIDLQSVHNASLALQLRLDRVGATDYVLRDWRMR